MKKTYSVFRSLLVICIAFGLTQCSTGATGKTANTELAPVGEYKIGIGDGLEINVWREPMLSGDTIVRRDGMISISLLGDVKAVDRTPMELKAEIQESLAKYATNPTVTVIVKTPASQKFYVIGEVKTPGEYDLVKAMSVVQGISRAGGFTEWAAKDKILLLRKENGQEKRIQVNFKHVVKGKEGAQNVQLLANDTIVVP